MYDSDIILAGQTYPGTDPAVRCYDTTCVGTDTIKINISGTDFTCTDTTPGVDLFVAGAPFTPGTRIICPSANEIHEICNTILDCPNSCEKGGYCNNGTCNCIANRSPTNCGYLCHYSCATCYDSLSITCKLKFFYYKN